MRKDPFQTPGHLHPPHLVRLHAVLARYGEYVARSEWLRSPRWESARGALKEVYDQTVRDAQLDWGDPMAVEPSTMENFRRALSRNDLAKHRLRTFLFPLIDLVNEVRLEADDEGIPDPGVDLRRMLLEDIARCGLLGAVPPPAETEPDRQSRIA